MATKKAEDTKKIVKATPADAVAKVEAVKKEEAAKAAAKAEAKPAAKKPAAKKPAAKTTAAKTEAPKAEAAKAEAKPAAKKPAAKKPAAKKPAAVKTTETVYVEYGNGQLDVAELVAKAKEAIGSKAVKELKIYYQPETGMVYYTADGETGSYSL